MKISELVDLIKKKQSQTSKYPFIISISGFGGSGKSTLATELKNELVEADVVSIDDFIVDQLSNRSQDWMSFDRKRFKKEILEPASINVPLIWQKYGWKEDKIIGQKSISKLSKYLIVEGCSLFHPDLISYYDFKIWRDLSLEKATHNGIARDRDWGVDNEQLWKNVWMPNEQDFFAKYRPDEMADIKY